MTHLPAGYQPPPAPAKKSHTLRTVLIVVGVVLVLCVGGAALGAYVIYRKVTDSTQPVRDAAHAFLGDIEAGNYEHAYDGLCAADRQTYTLASFTAAVDQPALRSHRIIGFSVDTTNGVSTGTIRAHLTFADSTAENRTFDLVKDGGAWHVCGNPFSA